MVHTVHAVPHADAWCYIIMAVPIVTNLNDVMLSGCTCDYSDRVDTDGSGSVSIMVMHLVICFLTMLRYIAILHACSSIMEVCIPKQHV